jgi:hypothetical protein
MSLRGLTFKLRRPASSNHRENSDPLPFITVYSGDGEFYARLQQIAASCNWQIRRASSLEDAASILRATSSPIIVYDRDGNGPGERWRDVVRRLSALPGTPCVLLASRVADNYLWQEVIRNHGHDLLCKFAADEHLASCLRMAWFWTHRNSPASIRNSEDLLKRDRI